MFFFIGFFFIAVHLVFPDMFRIEDKTELKTLRHNLDKLKALKINYTHWI